MQNPKAVEDILTVKEEYVKGFDKVEINQQEDIQRSGKYDDDVAALRKMQEEILAYTTENSESLPSLAYNSLNVPEILNINESFIYNYFTPNERSDQTVLDNGNNSIVNMIEDFTSIGAANLDSKPRYIRISFDISASENLFSLQDILNDLNQSILSTGLIMLDEESIKNNFIPEGALSNYYYTGIEFIDTIADRKIYSMLSSSIVFQEEDYSKLSLSKKAEHFLESIGEDQNFNLESKLNLFEVLTNYQAEGHAQAATDVQRGVTSLSKDPISQQSFKVKFNNLFISDITNFSYTTKNNVYADEMLALATSDITQDIQRKAIENNSSLSGVSSDQFEIAVEPLITETMTIDLNAGTEEEIINSIKAFKNEAKNFPEVKIFGILIQKYEITSDGIEEKPGYLIDDVTAQDLGIVDFSVRYGATYIYKIRTLSLVRTIFAIDESNNEIGFQIGSYIVASEGKTVTVECTENITPKPPGHIRARINYLEQKPTISWEMPVNPQRDVKRFQIFKRRDLFSPFTLVKEYDFDNSEVRSTVNEVAITSNVEKMAFPSTMYTDLNFDLKKDVAIYAVASVDAHGLSSSYSPQILIKYDKFSNKLLSNIISPPGAPKPYPNLYIDEDFFEDAMKTSGKTRCNVFFNPEYFEVYRKNEGNQNDPVGMIKTTLENVTDENEFPYIFHFVNIDNQKDQFLKFKIVNKSGPPGNIDEAQLNESNLTFELGS